MKIKPSPLRHLPRITIFFVTFLVGLFPVAMIALLVPPQVKLDKVMPILQDIREYVPGKGCKPNPLLLGLYINEYRGLRLGSEAVGSIEDTFPLKLHLRKIYEERKSHGLFDEKGNVVMEVIIAPGENIIGLDLVRVIDALKKEGAGPIYIDRNYNRTNSRSRWCRYSCVMMR
jgi:hypothetical protein